MRRILPVQTIADLTPAGLLTPANVVWFQARHVRIHNCAVPHRPGARCYGSDALSLIMLCSMNTKAISIFTFWMPRRMQQVNFRFRFACPYGDSAA